MSAKDLRCATEEEVKKITGGVEPGGVPPFGNIFGLEVYADLHLLQQKKIVFNAGDRSVSVAMAARDYRRLVRPQVVRIV